MALEFLTARQVSDEYFNCVCSYHKILKMAKEGTLPAKKLGKSYLFKRSELDVWAADQFGSPK